MTSDDAEWERQIGAAWSAAATCELSQTEATIESLVQQRPGDAAAIYELASVRDFAGREAEAEPLYRAALAAGLDQRRRPRAIVQLSSTLRNLERPGESVDLLEAELAVGNLDGLETAFSAFLALALLDAGKPRDAVALALEALTPQLGEYRQAISHYAKGLTEH